MPAECERCSGGQHHMHIIFMLCAFGCGLYIVLVVGMFSDSKRKRSADINMMTGELLERRASG